MSNSRGMLLLLAAVLSLSGCAAHERREAGTAVAAAGLVAAIVGASVAFGGCVPLHDDDSDAWSDTDNCSNGVKTEANPQVGGPIFAIGFGTAMTGAIIYGTGIPAR